MFLPIHFDPITEFSDIPEVQEYIKRDHQLLDRIPVSQRELSKALGLIATDAVAKLKVPLLSILADNDKIIDLNKTVELLKHSPLKWFKGGHGFVLEPGGPEMIAFELDAFVEKS